MGSLRLFFFFFLPPLLTAAPQATTKNALPDTSLFAAHKPPRITLPVLRTRCEGRHRAQCGCGDPGGQREAARARVDHMQMV